jgi:lysophospholipid acyltransferase (LPLAT)-like uncharacterized protein
MRRSARWTGVAAGQLLRLWKRSLRFEKRGLDILDANPHAILCCWHGRMQGPIFGVTDRGVLTMASQSSDGEVAAQAVARLGLTPARGSTGRGGVKAVDLLERWMNEGLGNYVGLTVDGPRGPFRKVRRGAVDLARRLGLPIIPCSFSARPRWMLTSWDHMLLAPPLARTVVEYAAPMTLGADEPAYAACARLRERLDSLTVALDRELHGRALWPDAAVSSRLSPVNTTVPPPGPAGDVEEGGEPEI